MFLFCYTLVATNTVRDTFKKYFLQREIQWEFCGFCIDLFPSNFGWRSGLHTLVKTVAANAVGILLCDPLAGVDCE